MGYGSITAFVQDANNQPRQTHLLSMVLPGGCQLACQDCIIGIRNEGDASDALLPSQYLQFLDSAINLVPVHSLYLAGEEPLLNKKIFFEYTVPLLVEAKKNGLKTGLVTNGLNLAKLASSIIECDIDIISVSLNGVGNDNAARIDKKGNQSYARVAAQLEHVADMFGNKLQISAILYPGKVARIERLVQQLAEWGITRLAISPLFTQFMNTSLTEDVSYLDSDDQMLIRVIERASRIGVHVTMDQAFDSLRILNIDKAFEEYCVNKENNVTLVRLSPSGAVKINDDIMRMYDEENIGNPVQPFDKRRVADLLFPRPTPVPFLWGGLRASSTAV